MCQFIVLQVKMKIVLLYAFVLRVAQGSSSLLPSPTSICGPEKEVALQSHGEFSSYTITLEHSVKKPPSLCRLRVTAPKSHVVNLQFMENYTITYNNETDNKIKQPSCVMSIYLPDNTKAPFWKGDPCSTEKMPDIDLLTGDFKILWTPPENSNTTIRENTFVLTAVGSGPFCKDPFQHTCMRIGRIPMLCISDHLVCDGVPNCPKSSTNSDEDPKLCKSAKNAWENFVVELVKKYRPQDVAGSLGQKANASDGATEWSDWQLVKKNVTVKPKVVNETHSATESISAMLNKYGPWGYLMMGLLICGTVLFFCGLWECCCKRPKPEGEPPPLTTPTAVLVMNCDQGLTNPMPPQYDDLDLPPSYTTLFPLDEGRYTTLSDEPSCSNDNNEKNDDADNNSSENSDQSTVVQESVQTNENITSTSHEQVLTQSDSGE